ncbi:EAL domain-containing protein [Consotaella salsifontis]|uniref:cyclic-guanylate-specific phosphodiesterase n=1 Tax=Consotaella salsifontis TaxID=1365950 RepID=A0A1T4MI88_9HYPH|nr:cyclic diguanylate phosphodiesterase [Consotaella salsifontis]SJZ66790.1 sensor c-di-GMP phosphodiesterase, contains CSS-motif sensor and EAL domain [Consotaella salsifontis]
MAQTISHLLSARQQNAVAIAFGCAIFVALVLVAAVVGLFELDATLASESRRLLAPFEETRDHVDAAFARLRQEASAEPCSAEFRDQMQKIAFLPDGLNQFFYAPDGRLTCASSGARFSPTIDLGPPDYVVDNAAQRRAVWLDRDLSPIGLEEAAASIIADDLYAVAIPKRLSAPAMKPLGFEFFVPDSFGKKRHYGGDRGLLERAEAAERSAFRFIDLVLYRTICSKAEICVALEAPLLPIALSSRGYVAVVLLIAGIAGFGAGPSARDFLLRRLSFEARFLRHLNLDSLICAYQPLMDLRTNEIMGCEVLARWRDVDGSLVMPGRFLPLIEARNLTRPFTRLVVAKAYAELNRTLPTIRRLSITFNISPRDLDANWLLAVFKEFLESADRFEIIIELVESETVDVPAAQREIQRLRWAGIKTYIDDFGTGYSSIHNLAALSVDGVKLDRAFAMAHDGSVTARMLTHAVEMIQSSGRIVVVEGVETAERLAQLRQITPPIDLVQGFYISRPVSIDLFASQVLAEQTQKSAGVAHISEASEHQGAAAQMTGGVASAAHEDRSPPHSLEVVRRSGSPASQA